MGDICQIAFEPDFAHFAKENLCLFVLFVVLQLADVLFNTHFLLSANQSAGMSSSIDELFFIFWVFRLGFFPQCELLPAEIVDFGDDLVFTRQG